MIIYVPCEIEIPDYIYIDGEQVRADVHTTPYGGLADVVTYESENGRNYISVKLDGLSVYVRYNGQSHTEQFGDIEGLVDYLMRSCDIGKSTKKSQPATKSFSEMVKEQRNKSIKKGVHHSPDTIVDLGHGETFRLGDWREREARDYQMMIDYLKKMEDKLNDFLWEGDFESADRFDGTGVKEIYIAIDNAIEEYEMMRDETLSGEWDPWF